MADISKVTLPNNETYNLKDSGAARQSDFNDLSSTVDSTIKTIGNYSTIIEDNTDFDTIVTAGEYRISSATSAGTMSNIPINRAGRLLVIGLTARAKNIQIYASTVNKYYIRYFNSSNVWSAWEEIPHGFSKDDFDELTTDVSELSDTVTSISNALTIEKALNWSDYGDETYPLGWRTGYYRSDDGTYTGSNAYIGTRSSFQLPDNFYKFTVTVPDGYSCRIYEYNSSGTLLRYVGNLNTTTDPATACVSVLVTKGYKYNVAVGKFSDNSAAAHLTSEFLSTISGIVYTRLNAIEYITGTWSSASGTWTGTSDDTEIYDGKKIILFMPYGGSGNATLNLTLSGGTTTGAKNVYYSGTTRMSTQYPQFSHVMLIYHSTLNVGGTEYSGWWAVSAPPIYDGTVV